MRRSSLITAGLLLALASLAQTKTDKAQVSWGAELSSRTDGDFLNIIDEAEDGIYQLMQFKKDLHVHPADYYVEHDIELRTGRPVERIDVGRREIRLGDERILFDIPYEHRWRAAGRLLGVDLATISPHAGHA